MRHVGGGLVHPNSHLTMADVATGWTECLPLVNRDGSLVVEAIWDRPAAQLSPTDALCSWE